MTDLITVEEAGKLAHKYRFANNDIERVLCETARTVIALHAQLADAQAAQAMAVGRAEEKRFRATVKHDGAEVGDLPWLEEFWAVRHDDLHTLAPASGLAILAELRAERDAASAVAATAYGASLDWEQILKDDALWQAQDDIAKSRVACMAAEADRDRLAAANAVLEARVAGLVEALKPFASVVKQMSQNHFNIEDDDLLWRPFIEQAKATEGFTK